MWWHRWVRRETWLWDRALDLRGGYLCQRESHEILLKLSERTCVQLQGLKPLGWSFVTHFDDDLFFDLLESGCCGRGNFGQNVSAR